MNKIEPYIIASLAVINAVFVGLFFANGYDLKAYCHLAVVFVMLTILWARLDD